MADLVKIATDNIEAFNAGDWGRYAEALAPDVVADEVATGRSVQGVDDSVQNARGWKEAFPDVKGTITTAVAAGNTVTIEVTWEGTHTGPLTGPAGTIQASNKRQTTRAVLVMNFEGDKIKQSRHYFDMMSLLQQIGALPELQHA